MVGLLLVSMLQRSAQGFRNAVNRMQSQNNLKQIGMAMHNYHSTHRSFPPAVVYNRDGKPLYSWRVLLLPYLEHDVLYKQFRLDEPWDGPNNIQLLSQMPEVYQHLSDAAGKNSSTAYQVIVGKGAAFEGTQGLRLKDFTDGTSNTILIVEAAIIFSTCGTFRSSTSSKPQMPAQGMRTSTGPRRSVSKATAERTSSCLRTSAAARAVPTPAVSSSERNRSRPVSSRSTSPRRAPGGTQSTAEGPTDATGGARHQDDALSKVHEFAILRSAKIDPIPNAGQILTSPPIRAAPGFLALLREAPFRSVDKLFDFTLHPSTVDR
jgi:hypothetical protein